jgi:hypothetical protein
MSDPEFANDLGRVPPGDWVVLTPDERRIVSHNPELRVALEEAAQKGVEDPVVMKAESIGKSFVIAG